MNNSLADLSNSYLLVARFPAGALTADLAPRAWWLVDRSLDESAARQRAFRLIPFVAHLGGEAVLMFVAPDGYGRGGFDALPLIRNLTASQPPAPEDLRAFPPAAAAEFQARCQEFHAIPARLQGGGAPRSPARGGEADPRSGVADARSAATALGATDSVARRLSVLFGRMFSP